MELDLSGKVAVVTGGSRGIGKAIARTLAREGALLSIVARDSEILQRTASEILAEGGAGVLPVTADTSDGQSVRNAFAEILDSFGRVDILVNNAARVGGGPPRPGIENLDDEMVASEVNTKVIGYLRCTRAVVPGMKASGWGRIINVSGLAARRTGNVVGSIRNVSVSALTKNLSDELGQFGINVTCVHPGYTWTEAVERDLMTQAAGDREAFEGLRKQAEQHNAIRRIVEPADIANVVAFLASPRSAAVTGDSIAVGGGVGNAIYY